MERLTDSPASVTGRLPPPSTPFPYTFSRDLMDDDTVHASDFHSSSHSSPTSSPPPGPSGSGGAERAQPSKQKKKKQGRFNTAPIDNVLGRWNPTLVLENAGSVARDHLASERTFLAYMRTSLTIASTGVALVQLFTISAATSNEALEKYSRPIGAIVICIGLATLLMGLVRYFMIQSALVGGNFPVARASTIMLALVMSAVIVAVFGIIVGVR